MCKFESHKKHTSANFNLRILEPMTRRATDDMQLVISEAKPPTTSWYAQSTPLILVTASTSAARTLGSRLAVAAVESQIEGKGEGRGRGAPDGGDAAAERWEGAAAGYLVRGAQGGKGKHRFCCAGSRSNCSECLAMSTLGHSHTDPSTWSLNQTARLESESK